MKRPDFKYWQKKYAWYAFPPLLLFYFEAIVKIACFGGGTARAFVYTGLFALSAGLGIAFLAQLLPRRLGLWTTRGLLLLAALLCAGQVVYFSVFKTFGTLFSMFTGADAVTQFWGATLTGIRDAAVPILGLAAGYAAAALLAGRIQPVAGSRRQVAAGLAAGILVPWLAALLLIVNDDSGILPMRYLYRESFIPDSTVASFGVLATLRLDAQALVFGGPLGTLGAEAATPDDQEEGSEEPEEPVVEPEVPTYGYNVTEIDFDALIQAAGGNSTLADMHSYFRDRRPTRQNEYTGYFAGKNLIWIVGEAFSTLALDPAVTPTLTRLASEGFVFENFYNPVWGVSTSDGEYVTLTGLIPKSGVWSFQRSGANAMPYGFGHLLAAQGYSTKAYHNHYYSYYGRNESHPNLGYEYKGLGNGLDVKETWPESDLEMMELTLPGDMQHVPFHTYYMAVSGHLNYTFHGNYMAAKNRDLVEQLPYSEGPKAYLASNAELDKAVAYILETLEGAGLLDDTVLVLSGDHYPYGLTQAEMEELAGHPLDERFEMYQSTLILWNSAMAEPVPVKKPCSSLDVLPTLANLFGISYDSRLLAGQDILSDAPGLVEFGDRSFITDLGRYDAKADTFTPAPGATPGEGYARRMLARVNDSFRYSALILENDYYRLVPGPPER